MSNPFGIKTWTTNTLDRLDERHPRLSRFLSKFVPEDWGNYFS